MLIDQRLANQNGPLHKTVAKKIVPNSHHGELVIDYVNWIPKQNEFGNQ